MANDERVEAAARAMRPALFVLPENEVGPGTRAERDQTRIWARAALSAAGVDALEAENARLREEAFVYEEEWVVRCQRAEAERDAARRELAEVQAGLEALAPRWGDRARSSGEGLFAAIAIEMRSALLAAAPSEPVSEDDLTRRIRESIPSLRAAAALSLELGNFDAARELNEFASERERALRGRVTEEGEG